MKRLFTHFVSMAFIAVFSLPLSLTAQTTNCPPPSATTVANITMNSAELGWTTTFLSSYFNLQYRPAGSAAWMQVTVQQIPFTLNNLNCGTPYEWQVQAICSNSGTGTPSPYAAGPVFTTQSCSTPNCPIPAGLTSSNISSSGAVLSWTSTSTTATNFNLRYKVASSLAWTTLNNVSSPWQLGNLNCNTQYEWQVQAVCMISPTGVATLSPWSPSAFFTTYVCQNNCPVPTGLATTNITQTGAVLSWNPVSTTPQLFNIRYTDGTSTTWTTINNVSSPYQLGGLMCGTTYVWQVQTICTTANGNVSLSAWSVSQTFTTLSCQNNCLAPTGLTATNISQYGAVLSWNSITPVPGGYNLRYRNTTTTAWINVNNVSSPWQLGGLACNRTYEWQVQAICANSAGAVSLSPWSVSAYFTTLPCPTNCPPPTGLMANNITGHTADLSWNAVPSAPGYMVRYRPAGSLAWMNMNAATNSVTLSNLVCGITYEWQVQALCGPVLNSNVNQFSAISVFTTLVCNTTCLPPTTLSVANITATSAQLAWNSTGASMYRIRYRSTATGSLWSFMNTAATTIQVNGLQPSTDYEWQVQSLCAPNSSAAGSPWSLVSNFQTLQTPGTVCPAPTGLTVSAVNQQGALMTWNAVAGAYGYNVRYRASNNNTNYITITTTMTLLQVGNLTAGTVYECQVQTICTTASGVVVTSAWSPLVFFTTPLMLNVWPNPANDRISLSYYLDDAAAALIEVRDIFGKLVWTDSRTGAAGSNELTIDATPLHEGWYSITLRTPSRTSTERVLIGH